MAPSGLALDPHALTQIAATGDVVERLLRALVYFASLAPAAYGRPTLAGFAVIAERWPEFLMGEAAPAFQLGVGWDTPTVGRWLVPRLAALEDTTEAAARGIERTVYEQILVRNRWLRAPLVRRLPAVPAWRIEQGATTLVYREGGRRQDAYLVDDGRVLADPRPAHQGPSVPVVFNAGALVRLGLVLQLGDDGRSSADGRGVRPSH